MSNVHLIKKNIRKDSVRHPGCQSGMELTGRMAMTARDERSRGSHITGCTVLQLQPQSVSESVLGKRCNELLFNSAPDFYTNRRKTGDCFLFSFVVPCHNIRMPVMRATDNNNIYISVQNTCEFDSYISLLSVASYSSRVDPLAQNGT